MTDAEIIKEIKYIIEDAEDEAKWSYNKIDAACVRRMAYDKIKEVIEYADTE